MSNSQPTQSDKVRQIQNYLNQVEIQKEKMIIQKADEQFKKEILKIKQEEERNRQKLQMEDEIKKQKIKQEEEINRQKEEESKRKKIEEQLKQPYENDLELYMMLGIAYNEDQHQKEILKIKQEEEINRKKLQVEDEINKQKIKQEEEINKKLQMDDEINKQKIKQEEEINKKLQMDDEINKQKIKQEEEINKKLQMDDKIYKQKIKQEEEERNRKKFEEQLKQKSMSKFEICQDQETLDFNALSLPFQKSLNQLNFKASITSNILNSYEKALLIGGYGVGKSNIFQKLTKNKINSQKNFPQSKQIALGFIVIDSPPFDLNQGYIKQQNVISEFSKLLNIEQNRISTFFLIVKFERLELMKKKFFSIHNYFNKFLDQIIVLITFWDLREENQEKQIQKEITDFFCQTQRLKIEFIEKDDSLEKIQTTLKKNMTGKIGITLTNTIFEQQSLDHFQNKIVQQTKANKEGFS